MNDEKALLQWMSDRLRTADIVRHYFDVKETGKASADDVEAIFDVVQKLMLGSCGFFASSIARRAGQDHLVWVFSKGTEKLLHAVIACSPQYSKEPLRGDFVDILGRGSLPDFVAAMERIAGPVDIEIGGPIEPGDYLEGEEAALVVLAEALPWTRQFMNGGTDDRSDFIEAIKAAGAFRRPEETRYTAEELRTP